MMELGLHLHSLIPPPWADLPGFWVHSHLCGADTENLEHEAGLICVSEVQSSKEDGRVAGEVEEVPSGGRFHKGSLFLQDILSFPSTAEVCLSS